MHIKLYVSYHRDRKSYRSVSVVRVSLGKHSQQKQNLLSLCFLSIYSLPYKNMYACHYIYMSGKSVQFSSVAQLCPTFCNPMDCSMPGFPVHQQLLDLTQTHVHPVPLCCPILLPSSVFPRNRIFFNQSALHIKWPKYWNFNFNISPSNEYSGLIYQD